MKLIKEFLYTYCTGGYYLFNVYKITDAAHNVYYVGERTTRGGTVIGNTEKEVKQKLDAQAEIITKFWSKIR